MGTGVYLESRAALDAFLRPILHDIVIIVEHGRRMTVTVTDVLLALKRNGRCELMLHLPYPLVTTWSSPTQRPGVAPAADATGPVPCCLPAVRVGSQLALQEHD